MDQTLLGMENIFSPMFFEDFSWNHSCTGHLLLLTGKIEVKGQGLFFFIVHLTFLRMNKLVGLNQGVSIIYALEFCLTSFSGISLL